VKRRGRGIACMLYPVGATSYPNPGSAFVKVNPDGTAVVFAGATDVGQGSTTVLAQIAAEALGVEFAAITMVTADTEHTPYDFGSVASRVTYVVGNAVRQAAHQAKQVFLAAAAEVLKLDVSGLDSAAGWVYAKGFPERRLPVAEAAARAYALSGRPPLGASTFNAATTFLDPETGHGKPYPCYVFATQIAEVEVDTETGEVVVVSIAAAHDCGRAVNPLLVEGQIEGGIAQGLGYGLLEEMVLEEGKVKNDQLVDYVIPTMCDMPEMRLAIVEEPEPTGPYGAKGIGEPSLLPTAPAILNAIYDAVGVRIRELPATPGKILAALQDMRVPSERGPS